MHRFLGRLHEAFDELSTDTMWALTPRELGECLEEVFAGQARMAALALGLVAQADRSDLPTHDAQPTMVSWLRDRVRLAPTEGKRLVRLARALEDYRVTRGALAAGSFPVASAAVIARALDALPAGVDPDVRAEAEEYLAGEAHAHDTHALRRLADHLDEVIDPDGADARRAAQLARAEAKAAREAFLTLRHDEATAVTEGSFRIPLVSGVKLGRMLESLTNPGRPDPIAIDDPTTGVRLSAEERRGHALVELVDRFPVGKLPKLGRSDPTLVVTMSLATLMGGLAAAELDTGQVISPGQARRLAARAGVIPAVLGTDDEVLDLGRRARFHNRPQRLAMLLQQKGTCAVQDCTRPAAGGDGAHLVAWSEGGPTDLANSALLCPRHHTLADHPDYAVTRLRPGRIRINRRC
ncbi:HNH endonuclease signature motif containing protein [Nocardioides panacihumi]|uniref:HNH endonuclease signature motif containing protein n=1 Tax=Nocardioides panacihumi TaxID=400774 RepID=A0ABN2R8W6_9ACTN